MRAEKEKTMDIMLPQEDKEEAEEIFSFLKSLGAERKKEIEWMNKGGKLMYDLLTRKA